MSRSRNLTISATGNRYRESGRLRELTQPRLTRGDIQSRLNSTRLIGVVAVSGLAIRLYVIKALSRAECRLFAI